MPARVEDLPSGWTVRRGEPTYPVCLEDLGCPPEALRGFGDATLLRVGLAVVGSRRATPYGLACARRFAGWAAAHGIVVISGAAYGCDRAAHEAAIESGGSTVAVLGCGADVDYPPNASALLDEMRRHHAVVSELEWGAKPLPYAFPKRNRIIAALSAAVLVVEAAPRSGTFSTVDHAVDANRQVLAVPGSVLSESSRGCNSLIRDGALPICDVDDLAMALEACGLAPHPVLRADAPPDPAEARLDPVERTVAASLRADAMSIEQVAAAHGLGIARAACVISRLETVGVVARHADGRYGASAG